MSELDIREMAASALQEYINGTVHPVMTADIAAGAAEAVSKRLGCFAAGRWYRGALRVRVMGHGGDPFTVEFRPATKEA